MNARHVDALVIGSGQGGGPLAGALARAGRRTVLIERSHIGGTCINEGCTPSKTMVASARVAYLARRAEDYGVRCDNVRVDLPHVVDRKRAIVRSFRSGSERRLTASGVEVLFADARFTGERRIEARAADGSTQTLTADLVIIDTGARPSRPSIPGLGDVPALDSTSIMELETLPGHLLVLGGGYVGLEFAQMFRRFGSRVTVIDRGPQLVTHEDADVAGAVLAILRDDGIDVVLRAETTHAARTADGVTLTVQVANEMRTVTGTHLLVATGRTPNTDTLAAVEGGVALDERGFVRVDARLATTARGVYAVGDVKGGPGFTHISYDDFRILRANLLEGGTATTEGRLVPYVMFIDPQLGGVGLTEREALAHGHKIAIGTLPMANVARAIETAETRGFMKVVVDRETQRILGAAVLGIEGGEVMSMLQLAMMGGLPYAALRDGVFAHPTLAESLNNLFGALTPV
ncbi:MAG TPA: mercuric reductase [Gemmatimonadaceae bacterium]|jgi:pyruvate/2-oxoglutarate dehydrogenase complex dihydrolipoamide dehydrogenase (E3) component